MDIMTEARQVAHEFGADLIYVDTGRPYPWDGLSREENLALFPFNTFVVCIGGRCANQQGCQHTPWPHEGIVVEVRQERIGPPGNESHWVVRCPECMRAYLANRWPHGLPA